MTLTVFPFRANWNSPVIERWQWNTSVMESHDGTEQRYGLSPTPRYSLQSTVSAPEIGVPVFERGSYLTRAIRDVMGREILYPLWHQAVGVPVNLSSGATTLSVSTAGREFDGAPSLLFWFDPFNYYVVTQGSYSESTLTFSALPGDVTAGIWHLYPLYPGRLVQSLSMHVGGLASAQVMIDFDYGPTISAASPDPDPFLTRPNRRRPLESAFTLADTVIDFGIGKRSVVPRRVPIETSAFEFSPHGFPEIHSFRRWLFARRGRQVDFRMPSHQTEYRLLADADSGSVTMDVARCGHDETVSGNITLLILKANRADYTIVTVTGSSPNGDSEEVLSLSSPLSGGIPRSNVWGIYRLMTCRLDSDMIEIAHVIPGLANCSIPIRSLS